MINNEPTPMEETTPNKNGIATAALTLGIFSLLCWVYPMFGFPIAVAGLVAGTTTRATRRGKWGLILSIIGLILTIGITIASVLITKAIINN